jgi:hypothetical protein
MEESRESGRSRGMSSGDDVLFGTEQVHARLAEALTDMHYLLSRDYPVRSSLALTGNRYRLRARQLQALQGMACSESDRQLRQRKELTAQQLAGKTVFLDGFNILILLETLLSGGFVFKGLDGCYRDISSIYGTYKKVRQTEEALVRVGDTLHDLGVEKVIWIFDAPVSNSGRMKALCYELAATRGYPWEIYLENAPDKYLVEGERVACSSDAWVLNECVAWFNLGGYILDGVGGERSLENVIALGARLQL